MSGPRELLGGRARDYVECYSTGFPRHGTLKETARACIEAGFRAFSGPMLMEMTGAGPHVPQHFTFRQGKLWPNERPGLGVTFDPCQAQLAAAVTEHKATTPALRRPDGSHTNW